jgi:DedD protein
MRTYVEEEEMESLYTGPGQDTEITLGMKSLLGVFFGSVLICGVFFGFGYSLGRGNAHPTPAAAEQSPAIGIKSSTATDSTASASGESAQTSPSPAQSDDANDSNLKTVISDPAASGSTPAKSDDTQYDYVATPGGPARKPAGAPLHATAKPHAAVAVPLTSAAAEPSTSSAPPAPALIAAKQLPVPTTPASNHPAPIMPAAATGSTMVQIAAISRKEDADILVSALKKRGYSVVVRNEPKDSLLHVQIGPFANRDDARAMRTRLLGDGYNAILK